MCLLMVNLMDILKIKAPILKIKAPILKMEQIALARIDFITRKLFEEHMLKVPYLFRKCTIVVKIELFVPH